MITQGECIRILRKEKGIKQMVFAEMIGISQVAVSQIETNTKVARPKTFIKILKALEISVPAFYLLLITEEDIAEEKREIFNSIYPIFKTIILNKPYVKTAS